LDAEITISATSLIKDHQDQARCYPRLVVYSFRNLDKQRSMIRML
jgi:hypothetical protein